VIGSDSAMTLAALPQLRTIEQPADKIKIISNSVILAGTGEVGLGQRFHEIVKRAWEEKKFKGSHIEVAKKLCIDCINDFRSTGVGVGQYGALLAFPCEKQLYLCEFQLKDFQPEFKDLGLWYCSMGSTQLITDPFLGFIRSIFWKDKKPNLSGGIFAVKWTLHHAIELNPGGVNGPVSLAILQNNDEGTGIVARKLSDEELDQHKQNIEELNEYIRRFPDQQDPDKRENVHEVPKK
jgi:hypothetical protein